MCGICGVFNFSNQKIESQKIDNLLEPLIQRGPDSTGILLKDNIAFGHARLKVIDTSYRSNQPLIDMDLGLMITFNGCIYNYMKLKKKLLQFGYNFFSDGDTEVILKAWHKWGYKSLEMLDGDFAFAIWNFNKKELYLGRDRLGVKPLYFTQNDNEIIFSSNIQSLLKVPETSKIINKKSLQFFLTLHSIVPPPNTIIKDIQKLPPATIYTINEQGILKKKTYWETKYRNLKTKNNGKHDSASLEKKLEKLLLKATKKRMVSDIPVGVLLSGGLDSSLLVEFMSQLSSEPIKTFSIGFEGIDSKIGNEFYYSDYIVDKYNTDHTKIIIDNKTLYNNLWDTIKAMSEPMVSYDNIAFYLLSKTVSDITGVVLSGQGADELFGGYHWHQKKFNKQNISDDYAKYFFDRSHGELLCLLQRKWSIVDKDIVLHFIDKFFKKHSTLSPLEKVFTIDGNLMLSGDPVKRIDNMTMAWGVEARVPFLDKDIINFASKIPSKLKIKDGGKGILKSIASKYFPHEFVYREKGYFPVPALKYLDEPFLGLIKKILFSNNAKKRNLYNLRYVDKLLKNPQKYITPVGGAELWQITILEMWLQIHIDNIER